MDFIPVCPEVEAGFGIPREAMRLLGTNDGSSSNHAENEK